MATMLEVVQSINVISILIVLLLAISVVQGYARGGVGSARHLTLQISDVVITLVSLLLTWKCAGLFSPLLHTWLVSLNIAVPDTELGWIQQSYYMIVTGVRDFPLLRFGVILIFTYGLVKHLLQYTVYLLMGRIWNEPNHSSISRRSFFSSMIGGIIGALTGAGRALILIAALFVYTALFPQTQLTSYIQASEVYQKGATEIVQPFTGDFIANKVPVFARAVEEQFNHILERKYEVIDARIPNDIAAAAAKVTENARTDEEKARSLYRWIGTRVQYDWDKVDLYEQKQIWNEQTPEDTFVSKKGVCIDYSRLYAVMARSLGMQVKVETGLGYDGKGGYGPHAWNTVYLSELDTWVPLDATWVSSGGNWFNPPQFYDTHIKGGVNMLK